MRHVTEHGKYDETGKETGQKVYRTGKDGVPVTVVVELVVARQGQKSTEPWAQGEEYLRCRVYPNLNNKTPIKIVR